MMVKNLIWQELQTALVALIFAVLIWIYAEGENVKTYENVPIMVKFVSPPGKPVVIEPAFTSARLSLRCPTGLWNDLRLQLEKDGMSLEVSPDIPQQVLDLRERLKNDPLFTARGIQVTDVPVEPVTVWVEPRQEITMGVEVMARDLTLSPATPFPDAVKVSGPASQIKLLEGKKILARIDDLDPNLPEGISQTREKVNLVLPPDTVQDARKITLEPERVRATFTLRRRTLEYVVNAVPVIPAYRESDRYAVVLNPEDRTIPTLTLEGPSNIIEGIKRKEITLFALRADLFLTSEELDDRRITEKKPQIVNLPEGVRVRSEPKPVRFRIQLRAEPSSEVTAPMPTVPTVFPAPAPTSPPTTPTASPLPPAPAPSR